MTNYQITGAQIIPLDDGAEILEGFDLWLRDGRIEALTRSGGPPPSAERYEVCAFRNAVAIPGLINAHSHSASSLQRGRISGAPLDIFIMDAMARRSKITSEQVRIAAQLHALEMLKHGITGVVDHLRNGAIPSVEGMNAAMSAYRDIGIRAVVAPMFEDLRYINSVPIDQARLPQAVRERWLGMKPPAAEDYFAMMREVIADARRYPLVDITLGVDGPQRCSRRLLELAGEFAAEFDCGLHTHLLEAKTQAVLAPGRYGGSFVAHLAEFGLVGPKATFAHFVWCTGRDIELAAELGANVVHNPVSNLVLGSGLQPTVRLRAAGVNVALGTDGGSSNAVSILEQAKMSMLLSRIGEIDCDRWITAPQALQMACAGGARVMARGGETGVIRVGARADIAIVDLDNPNHMPLSNIWNHLVMYENGLAAHTVFVNGERVIAAGRSTRVDEAEIYAKASTLAARDDAANESFLAVARAERSVFQPLITEVLRQPLDIERFAALR